MKTTTLRLSADLYARLERQAQRDHRSVNAQIVYLIERGVTAEEARETEETQR
jgi:hypothetical protein